MAFSRKWTPASKEEMRAKVDGALALIKKGVEALATSEDWLDMLRTMSRFHRYSFGNQMLIHRQRPSATYVAGFETWKDLGRYVKKGAKGIQILAPRTYRKTVVEEGEEKQVAGVYFRAAYVFDIADTEVMSGVKAPLLITDLVKTLSSQNEAASAMAVDLGAWLAKHGITVHQVPDLGRAHGYYLAENHEIALNDQDPSFQQAKTLVHETAHILLHTHEDLRHLEFQHKYSKDREKIQGDAREVEAESTAFVVLNALGIDSGEYSFGYVASWSQDDHEIVSKVATRVRAAALFLLDDVLGHAEEEPGEDTETVPIVGESEISVEKREPRTNPAPATTTLPQFYGYLMDPAIYALEVGTWTTDAGTSLASPWRR